MAINKAAEVAGAPAYPANRLGPRERKTVQVAESFDPATPADWSSVPASQDSAISALAACNVGQKAKTVSVLYDFAAKGGAVGNIDLGVTLPNKAIVVEVVSDVITAPTSSGSNGTIRLNVPTDGNLAAAVTADGAATLTHQDPNTSGTSLPKKLTAARQVRVTVATSAITAGKIRYHIRYYQGD